jgi:uncharacterized damage-inducible protein DinB
MSNDNATRSTAIDSTRPPAELIAAYEAGIDELRNAVSGMSSDELTARPIAGRWSTLEVVCHLADCEQFLADRMKRTIAMDRPLLMGADGFRYPEALGYQRHDVEEELALVEITRRQMARCLCLAAPTAWDRTAVHSEFGLMTLRQLVAHAVNHMRHHLAFVEEKHEALKSNRGHG